MVVMVFLVLPALPWNYSAQKSRKYASDRKLICKAGEKLQLGKNGRLESQRKRQMREVGTKKVEKSDGEARYAEPVCIQRTISRETRLNLGARSGRA